MSIGKAQAAQSPTALGSMLQASTYGATIPTVYGMTLSPLLAIWAANLRQGGSTKKFKQLKKGITAYVENIDFLIGSNPIMGVNQMWINGATIPLALVTYTTSGPGFPFWGAIPVGLDPTTMTAPDPDRAREFYEHVLQIPFSPAHPGTWRAHQASPPLGIRSSGDATPEVQLTFRVDDIAAAVERVRAAGGHADDPARMPFGLHAECTDDAGMIFRLVQPTN